MFGELQLYLHKKFMTSNSEEFYKNLKKQLKKTSKWPSLYLYKFILPTENEHELQKLNSIFDNTGAVINTKQSSKGKYTSVSIHVKMNSADHVISKYKEVGEQVEGVISL